MKYFEIGVVILIFASVLRTCSYDNDVSDKELCNQFFSHNFPDETISVVRTRRLYSYSPLQWENPTSADELIWEKSEWMSMSNMYAIVVIDRRVSRWVFKLTDEYCPFFGNEMKAIRNTCEYNVKDDTLKPSDAVANSVWQMKDCEGNDGCEIVDLEKMFNRYTSCPCIYFGNGENGVLFWRGGTNHRFRWLFMTLLWAGKPCSYYTVRNFKSWEHFWAWDGELEGCSAESLPF